MFCNDTINYEEKISSIKIFLNNEWQIIILV